VQEGAYDESKELCNGCAQYPSKIEMQKEMANRMIEKRIRNLRIIFISILSSIFIPIFILFCMYMNIEKGEGEGKKTIAEKLGYLLKATEKSLIPEIAWIVIDDQGDNVYIGFDELPDDLIGICNDAAAFAGSGVTIWAIDAEGYKLDKLEETLLGRSIPVDLYYTVTARSDSTRGIVLKGRKSLLYKTLSQARRLEQYKLKLRHGTGHLYPGTPGGGQKEGP